MGYRTLLSILDTPKTTRQVTDFTVAIANQFQSHVIGAHAEAVAMVPLVAPMEIPDPATVQALQDMAHQETESVEKIFREIGTREGLSHEWRSFVTSSGFNSASLIDSARSVDLVIAAQGETGMLSETRSELESFLFESGRPVLLIPHILKEPKPIRRVLVAWNGSREAARATFDALPFLMAAEEVEIFTVDASDTSTQTGAIAGAQDGLAVLLDQHHLATPVGAIAQVDVLGPLAQRRLRAVRAGDVQRTALEHEAATFAGLLDAAVDEVHGR